MKSNRVAADDEGVQRRTGQISSSSLILDARRSAARNAEHWFIVFRQVIGATVANVQPGFYHLTFFHNPVEGAES